MLSYFREEFGLYRKAGWGEVIGMMLMIAYMAPLVGLFLILERLRIARTK